MFKSILFVPVIVLLMTCRTNNQNSTTNIQATVNCENNCSQDYLSKAEFDKFGIESNIGGIPQKVLKFVYKRDPLTGQGQVYFFDTKVYPYHWDFVRKALGESWTLGQFNKNYVGSGHERLFNLGTLILHGSEQNQKSLIEMWSGDTIEGKYLTELYLVVQKSLKDLPKLYVHPLSTQQEKSAKEVNVEGVNYAISTAELYKDRDRFILNPGEAVGYLTFVNETDCVDYTKIAVYDRVPNELGLVAGVVTAELQTPLSHINVKSVNRGTLNMSLFSAKEKLKTYEGKLVHII